MTARKNNPPRAAPTRASNATRHDQSADTKTKTVSYVYAKPFRPSPRLQKKQKQDGK